MKDWRRLGRRGSLFGEIRSFDGAFTCGVGLIGHDLERRITADRVAFGHEQENGTSIRLSNERYAALLLMWIVYITRSGMARGSSTPAMTRMT